ncbi:uncharacterized protein Dwil_GK25451 [Drosophila willistoni]|uniref:CHK kinase-like domain-containing protein n=1 Tax=Drosophila willistoni TaxID=7260 RepID=B4NDK8_DROWI|nr:uncharacterized protein LOC6648854 [Drosophila willistoni]XP_046868388.1 uncharacterized protein LOC6648854 [Drosophila willistoni]EDW81830.1 uncharacterized protein Dwil_GK25451 [Drosophila willistoni]
MSTVEQQVAYIKKYVIYDILKYFGKDYTVVSHTVDFTNGIGFMSTLYTVELKLQLDERIENKTLVVKFMKGSPEFRETSKSYTQFANEVYAYAEVLPAYEHLLRSSHLNTDIVSEFVPHPFLAKFGVFDNLSTDRESVLALKHLKNDGYILEPSLSLRRDQLEAMSALIGKYHALGYATRILQPLVHERLKSGVVPLHFTTAEGQPTGVYDVLHGVAFARFFEYYERQKSIEQDSGLDAALKRLKEKYLDKPTELLERIRTQSCDESQPDSYFSTILHGDYNRNNVLFHYGPDGKVDNIKMLDFQELRFSTIALDLSFFMYMNIPFEERSTIFPQLLKYYHKHMYELLELVLQRNQGENSLTKDQVDQYLSNYSFERFQSHFKRYAFYGVMICMHFLPWLLAEKEECDKLAHLFETNMHGPEFYQLSIDIAGDAANQEIFNIVRHAYEQGYMDEI